MRKFTIRRGKFTGEHNIYASMDEAKSNGILNIIHPWHSPECLIGDWVVSDDGFVLQCLHRYTLHNKVHKSGQFTDCYRFPNGTFYVYVNAKNERIVGKNFYASVAHNNKDSLGNTSRLGKYLTPKKKLFVTLISEGTDPHTAYLKSFNRGFATYNINKLLNDPIVRDALMQELQPFITKVENEVKEKTGLNLTDFIANELVKIITFDTTKLALKERRENIKLILTLFGEQIGLVPPKQSKQREIQDANYELIRAPELGQGS